MLEKCNSFEGAKRRCRACRCYAKGEFGNENVSFLLSAPVHVAPYYNILNTPDSPVLFSDEALVPLQKQLQRCIHVTRKSGPEATRTLRRPCPAQG